MPDATSPAVAGAVVLAIGFMVLAGCGAGAEGEPTGVVQEQDADGAGAAPSIQVTADTQVPSEVRQLWADDAVDAAYAVNQLWGPAAVPSPVRVMLAGSSERFVDLSGVAGSADVPATVSAGPDRIVVVHPDAWGTLDARGRILVLTHEITHLAIDGDGSLPWWLAEGAAEYTAYRDEGERSAVLGPVLRDRLAAGPAPAWPVPAPGAVDGGDEGARTSDSPQTSGARSERYAAAWLAVEFLVDRYGEDAVVQMTASAGRGHDLDAAAVQYLGVAIADVDEAWADWWDREIQGRR